MKAGADGAFSGDSLKPGSYLSFHVAAETERVMLLHGVGHDFVYVNDELRAGDPYGYGWLRLPVLLKKGDNHLLFRVSRGRLKAVLTAPPADVSLALEDATVPSVRERASKDPLPAGIVVVNASKTRFLGSFRVAPGATTPVAVLPMSVRKAPVELDAANAEPALERTVELLAAGSTRPAAALPVPRPPASQASPPIETFTSAVDGSVQYYAVLPATRIAPPPALVLSLHGASVEASGQAAAYAPKRWATIVCPTNRRPYGFDWEDWGRLDAMEVLEHAQRTIAHDSSRVYLTGHSMGGHGTWQIACTFPDRFAAIGPSAGWASFWSYGGAPKVEPKDDVERMLRRAANPSDTTALLENLRDVGVYALHGDADDNVPVSEMRAIVDRLKTFHEDLAWHEQPGAGHWWDLSDAPGADCVDWPPLFQFFGRHAKPPEGSVSEVDFTTASPGVSASCRWATIAAQERPLEWSRVRLRHDPRSRTVEGTTQNVAELLLWAGTAREPYSVRIDGTVVEVPNWPPVLGLRKRGGAWERWGTPPAERKRPARCGPFKAAFDHRFLLVHGTKGTPEENAWALAKVRYDSEAWYYRANGSVDVVPDVEWDPVATKDRSVILYGNADTNAAWDALLKDSPVQVRRGLLKIGSRETKGDDLACLFLRPRPGSDVASVGVVTGTGLLGLRLCDRMPYFTSGVHYPDVTVFRADMLSKGSEGVRAVGFFGNDWSVEGGEFVFRD